jgi:hypothetical protein
LTIYPGNNESHSIFEKCNGFLQKSTFFLTRSYDVAIL